MPTDRLRELDLNLLITLDALLKHTSVTRAAEDLGMSQSAVSHALAKLRDVFGDPLFIKTRNRMIPTPKAVALSATVSQIVTLARNAVMPQVAFGPETAERTITLCLDDMGELAILPQLMAKLRVVAPHCTLRTAPADGVGFKQVIESGLVDLAITSPLAETSDLMQQKLYSHRFTFIASQQCSLDSTITAEQCAAMEHIAYLPARRGGTSFKKALEEVGITRRVRLSTPHSLIVPLLVERDPALIAMVPRLLADTYVNFANIKMLHPTFALPRIEVYQYWNRRFDADPFNIWLRAFVRDLFFLNPALHIE